MGKYAVNANAFASPITTPDTAISIEAASSESAEVVELIMTGSGTSSPADISHRAQLFTCTFATQGTPGSTPTPEVMRQGGRVSSMTADIAYTVEPTTLGTVSPVAFGFNQRGGMRWAVPRGEGERIQGDLTVKGLAWTCVANTAGTIDACMQWWEDV